MTAGSRKNDAASATTSTPATTLLMKTCPRSPEIAQIKEIISIHGCLALLLCWCCVNAFCVWVAFAVEYCSGAEQQRGRIPTIFVTSNLTTVSGSHCFTGQAWIHTCAVLREIDSYLYFSHQSGQLHFQRLTRQPINQANTLTDLDAKTLGDEANHRAHCYNISYLHCHCYNIS